MDRIEVIIFRWKSITAIQQREREVQKKTILYR